MNRFIALFTTLTSVSVALGFRTLLPTNARIPAGSSSALQHRKDPSDSEANFETRWNRIDEYSGLFTLESQRVASSAASSWKALLAPTDTDTEMAAAAMHLAPLLTDIRKLKVATSTHIYADNEIDTEIEKEIEMLVVNVAKHMETTCNDLLASNSFVQDETNRAKIADTVRDEFRPFLHTSRFCDQCIRKPRGYAGDYQAIDYIYANEPVGMDGNRRIGSIVDRISLDFVGAQAVRNRRTILFEEIRSLVRQRTHTDEALEVTSMVCGPARELHDVFVDAKNNNNEFPNMKCHLIDLDDEALEVAKTWMDEIPDFPHDHVSLHQNNLLWLAAGKETLNLPPQDCIYSAGYHLKETVKKLGLFVGIAVILDGVYSKWSSSVDRSYHYACSTKVVYIYIYIYI
jgi:predicted 2-oxoglutarate/Fe(II)-dependent dioxygenase YbiX